MFCIECGKKLVKNSKFCPNCGKEVEVKEAVVETPVAVAQPVVVQQPKDNNHLANVLCTISVSLYFGMPFVAFLFYCVTGGIMSYGDDFTSAMASFFSSIIGILSSLSTLAAYVLMIVARVKCPQNTFGKVLMWVYIALFVMGILTTIVLMVTCVGLLASCGSQF